MSLPTWVARRASVGLMLLITCPRATCGRQAQVDLDWGEGGYATRPCPYCFRAATVPDELRNPKPARRVVRRRTTTRRKK
jgi:hypothetical protein